AQRADQDDLADALVDMTRQLAETATEQGGMIAASNEQLGATLDRTRDTNHMVKRATKSVVQTRQAVRKNRTCTYFLVNVVLLAANVAIFTKDYWYPLGGE
ncbi:hypothetical protein KIPB_014262, partial [Kipferlia bialata]